MVCGSSHHFLSDPASSTPIESPPGGGHRGHSCWRTEWASAGTRAVEQWSAPSELCRPRRLRRGRTSLGLSLIGCTRQRAHRTPPFRAIEVNWPGFTSSDLMIADGGNHITMAQTNETKHKHNENASGRNDSFSSWKYI